MSVVATAPGKVNLLFRVGSTRDDGYHEVLSIYQAVSIREQVRVRSSSSARLLVSGSIIREQLDRVPRDGSNLVVRAAQVLADAYPAPERDAQGLEFEILKEIPLLGGMAGGSADAAAALVAVAKLWEIDVPRAELQLLAARLGSDVPFSLLGGTALGQGRGEKLTELESSPLHFVLVFSTDGLSTPEVFRTLDARRATWDAAQLNSRTTFTANELAEISDSLRSGNPERLAGLLENDLEAPACELLPQLAETLTLARSLGALHAQVSGSGPSIFLLAESEAHASSLCAAMRQRNHRALTAVGNAPGAQLG